MAFPKTVKFILILLVMVYILDKQGYRQPPSVLFKGLMAAESCVRSREKQVERILSFTLNADFDPAVYKDTSDDAENQTSKYIPNLQPFRLMELQTGRTIPIYSVSAHSFLETQTELQKTGLFTQLAAKNSKIYSGIEITKTAVPDDCTNLEGKFTCQSKTHPVIVCFNEEFGEGPEGYKAAIPCGPNEVGERTAVCKASGNFEDEQDSCILKPIQELLMQSEALDVVELPEFLDQLSNVTVNFTEEVVNSSNNIIAVTQILDNVAKATSSFNISLSTVSIEDVLLSAGVLTTDRAKDQWKVINANNTNSSSVSSTFLQSLETITHSLTSGSFNIPTEFIFLNKTTFTDTFTGDFNSSVEIDIPAAAGGQKSITVITFSSMDNVLPARDQVNSSNNAINGRVVLIQSNGAIDNISLTFDVLNDSLKNPKCVFWNFTLFDGLGGWDDKGCMLEKFNRTVTCRCDHLTSFSILMSPEAPDDPVLDFITYFGVGISMASLVICLIIEAIVWRKIRKSTVAYLRHVSIVNIAVSLLIANIWFIIGAAISDAKEKNTSACSAATFFIHFFYLSLFFWMLASALLLIYRTINVFNRGLSKAALLAIGFCLGYGAPFIIASVSFILNAPKYEYIRGTGVCWLSWEESRALLAFVIPALSIVVINLIILCVVMYKIFKRREAQAGVASIPLVFARILAVLTPIFGLTWGLGVGTMVSPDNMGIHVSFVFFNSLQGFFILVFVIMLDKKVQPTITSEFQVFLSQIRSIASVFRPHEAQSLSSHQSASRWAFFQTFTWRRGRARYIKLPDHHDASDNVPAADQETPEVESHRQGFLQKWRRGRDGSEVSAAESGESRSFDIPMQDL
ncbi:adhesion G-protein coupled receptor F1 isoform X2 [Parambassis ranga]|uniref:Adhesion G-protein coupled receptor F1 isoform X2 n=1 Tax=Parambassis ranga TaxID=210632 RepID=A0A6P7HJ43_9TELE|nr:adhesion G-protein coupled receptor F1-like isoform X2 [Parambassis ranga]